jgi:hypothetical protein
MFEKWIKMMMMRFCLLHTWIPLIPTVWFGETENKIQDKMAEVVEDQAENFADANEDLLGIQEQQVSLKQCM